MPKLCFSETELARLPSAQTGTDWYSDTRLEGLLLAVGKRKRSFYITKSLRNRQIRMKVGEWPLMKVVEARARGHSMLNEIGQGNDPRRLPDQDLTTLTVQQVLDRYIAARTSVREKTKSITPGTAQNYRDLFRCHASRWLGREIGSISCSDVVALHDRIRFDSAANKLVRVFFSLQRSVGISPPVGFLFNKEERKENGIKPAARSSFGAAILSVENASRRAAWLLGVYTGIRKNTLLALEWDHIDFAARTVFIAKMKNRHARTLPLSRQAVAVLRSLEGLHPKWVLPSFDGSKSGHLIEVRDDAIDASICFHDTRRVFSECAGECLLPEYAIGHLRGDVVNESMSQRYMSHLNYEVMREPTQRISDHVDRQLFPKPKAKKRRSARSKAQPPQMQIAA